MIYNITCLVCMMVMLVGRMLVPGVYDGIITSTDLDAVDTVAGSLRGENSTRERVYHDMSQITVMTGITVYTTVIQNICPVCTFSSTCTVYRGDKNTIG